MTRGQVKDVIHDTFASEDDENGDDISKVLVRSLLDESVARWKSISKDHDDVAVAAVVYRLPPPTERDDDTEELDLNDIEMTQEKTKTQEQYNTLVLRSGRYIRRSWHAAPRRRRER